MRREKERRPPSYRNFSGCVCNAVRAGIYLPKLLPMRPTIALAIPQPCSESWDAMTPTSTGRHCAACQKTVVDFTLKTDAEILAYLAQPGAGTCGRFWEDQLARPLRPPGPPLPRSRWRTWLAAVAALWGLREATARPAAAQPPTAEHPPKKAGRATPASFRPAWQIRGVVRDAATNEPLPGVAVFLKAENRNTITDSAGRFRLRVPAGRSPRARHTLVLHAFGYDSQTIGVPPSGPAAGSMAVRLRANGTASGAEIVGYEVTRSSRQMISGGISSISAAELPAPNSPAGSAAELPPPNPPAGSLRRFCQWLTKPFHHTPSK
jgi:hypothetical protein